MFSGLTQSGECPTIKNVYVLLILTREEERWI